MGQTWDFNIQLSTIILSPGEIKRREVSWTLTKQLDAFAESRQDQEEGGELNSLTKQSDAFADPDEIKWSEVSWTLTKQLDAFADPDEIKRREVS